MVTIFFMVHASKDVLFSDQQILWLLFWADDNQRLELPKLLHLDYVIDMILQNDGIIQYVRYGNLSRVDCEQVDEPFLHQL